MITWHTETKWTHAGKKYTDLTGEAGGVRFWLTAPGLYSRSLMASPGGEIATQVQTVSEAKRKAEAWLKGRAKQNPRKARNVRARRNPAPAAEVAATILQQLGGQGRVSAMLGRPTMGYGTSPEGPYLSIKFASPHRGPNYVKITLTPADTYTVEFSKVVKYDLKPAGTYTDVYAEQLKPLFERVTGLYLSLGTMGRSNPCKAKRNPARPDDDVTKPYPFAKKEGEYGKWGTPDGRDLRGYRDQAMHDRDEWGRTASASQSVEARASIALKAAEKAHAAAAKQAQHDYAVYGWHADDTSTIAQERKRRKERAESRKDDVRDEIAALSNPRRRNPHERWFSGSGPRPARYRFTQRFLTGPLAGKVITDTDDLPKMVGAVHETANGGTYRIESCEKIGAANPRRRNPSPEIHSEGLPARAPRGYVRIYTVPGDDMMATPTRRFDNIVDAVAHARRVGRHVFVDDVSKERARRYGVG